MHCWYASFQAHVVAKGPQSAGDLTRACHVSVVPTGIHEVQAVQQGARGGKRIRMGWKSTLPVFSIPTYPSWLLERSTCQDRRTEHISLHSLLPWLKTFKYLDIWYLSAIPILTPVFPKIFRDRAIGYHVYFSINKNFIVYWLYTNISG